VFLSFILFLQIDENNNYNVFFLETPEELRLVGENYRGGDRTPSPVTPESSTCSQELTDWINSDSSDSNGFVCSENTYTSTPETSWNFNFWQPETKTQYPLPLDENAPISKCYSKHISTLYNSYGKVLKTSESVTNLKSFSENSPFTALTIVTDENEVATKLKVQLLAYCETTNTFLGTSKNLNMLDSSDLTVSVFSTDYNYDEVQTIQQKVDLGLFPNTNLNKNAIGKWNEIASVDVDLKTINDRLEKDPLKTALNDQYLDSLQRIEVTGTMKIESIGEGTFWSFTLDPSTKQYGSTQNSYIQVRVIPTETDSGFFGGSSGGLIPEGDNTHTPDQQKSCIILGGILSGNLCTIQPTVDEKCNAIGGELNGGICTITKTVTIEKDGKVSDESKDDEPKELDYGILNYKKLLNCDSADCYNDADFIPIYALFGAILLLGVFQTKQQSRVVMMS
jgi:hypothetical protein